MQSQYRALHYRPSASRGKNYDLSPKSGTAQAPTVPWRQVPVPVAVANSSERFGQLLSELRNLIFVEVTSRWLSINNHQHDYTEVHQENNWTSSTAGCEIHAELIW